MAAMTFCIILLIIAINVVNYRQMDLRMQNIMEEITQNSQYKNEKHINDADHNVESEYYGDSEHSVSEDKENPVGDARDNDHQKSDRFLTDPDAD